MSVEEVHEGDIGTVFEATMKDGTTVVDLTDNTSIDFIFQRPDGSSFTKEAELVGDGTDGKMKYVVEDATILTPAGIWHLQAKIVMPDPPAGTWRSNRHKFRVYENIA